MAGAEEHKFKMIKNTTKNKIIPIILGISILFFLFTPQFTHAWDSVKWAENKIIVAIVGLFEILLNACAILTGWTGSLLDLSIDWSLGSEALTTSGGNIYNSGIVKTGWETLRDISNLFFIFILIFIGIATILQISSYHYKNLLVKIILAALLINFSMTITLLIIDSSNILAMEFLCKMSGNTCNAGQGLATTGSDSKSLSAVLASGLSFQTIYGKSGGCIKWDETGSNECIERQSMSEFIDSKKLDVFKIMLVYIFGSGLLLISAFLFLAAAGFFIIRTLTLMFLVMLSPLAFIAMALGSGFGGMGSKQWWDQLLKQCFFAPIYLFFIYVITKHITDIKKIGDGKSFADLIMSTDTSNIAILMQFVVMAGVLIGALMLAKSMGGTSAGYGITGAHWARKKAQGYAGKVSRFATGRGAEKLVQSKRMGRIVGKLGMAGRPLAVPLAKLAETRQKDISQKAKKYLQYAPANLANIMPTLLPTTQKSIVKQLNDKKLSEMMSKMTDEAKLSLGRIASQDKDLKIKTAKASGNLEIGTKIITGYDAIADKDVKNFTDNLNTKELPNFISEKVGESEALFNGFFSSIKDNEKDFRALMKTPKQIENMSKMLNKRSEILRPGATPEQRKQTIVDALKNLQKNHIAEFINSSPGAILLTRPSEFSVERSKGKEEITRTVITKTE